MSAQEFACISRGCTSFILRLRQKQTRTLCNSSSADFFRINFFSKEKIRDTIRVSNSLDPDQARRFVGPDLGPNCLQNLSAEDTCR